MDGTAKGKAILSVKYEEETFPLCTLSASCPQQPLNLVFSQGEEVAFTVQGN